jgi:hypothetical protein
MRRLSKKNSSTSEKRLSYSSALLFLSSCMRDQTKAERVRNKEGEAKKTRERD